MRIQALVSLVLGCSVLVSAIPADSVLGRTLLSQAQPAESNSLAHRQLDDSGSYSFLGHYAIKFQGCHHVQQWNNYADEESDVRIMTKRLARFRLCPSDQCSNDKSAGCTSKYGDYVVDMDTFVQAYLEALEEDQEELCQQVQQDCYNTCGGNGDSDCLTSCYTAYDALFCYNSNYNNGGNDNFDAREYSQCQALDLGNGYNYNNYNNGNRRLDQQAQYYIGAYCADQGGEIRLGIFSDDTCTTFVSNGASMFSTAMGYELPYSKYSLISTRCFACSQSYNYNNGNSQVKEVCSNIYEMSGKCETRMSIDYPNESSCNYIEGVKIIRQDGVIRTSSTRKSKTAAVAIGLFSTMSVLLAGYVFYLRTKLARAQINLAAASQTLT